MKEFEVDFKFRDGEIQGLRRFSNESKGSKSLTECHNWAPSDVGLEPHEQVTQID